jgi:acyl dehydratase
MKWIATTAIIVAVAAAFDVAAYGANAAPTRAARMQTAWFHVKAKFTGEGQFETSVNDGVWTYTSYQKATVAWHTDGDVLLSGASPLFGVGSGLVT